MAKYKKVGCRDVSRTQSNIYDRAVNYIRKNSPSQIFNRVLNKRLRWHKIINSCRNTGANCTFPKCESKISQIRKFLNTDEGKLKAAICTCSRNQLFLKISQNSQGHAPEFSFNIQPEILLKNRL